MTDCRRSLASAISRLGVCAVADAFASLCKTPWWKNWDYQPAYDAMYGWAEAYASVRPPALKGVV